MKASSYLKIRNTDTIVLALSLLVLIAITSLYSITGSSISFLQLSNRNSANSYVLKDKIQKLFADVLLMESVQRSIDFNEGKNFQAGDQVETDLKELQPLVYKDI